MLSQMFLANITILNPISSSGQQIQDPVEEYYILGYIAV
jgi:hypothetical protein